MSISASAGWLSAFMRYSCMLASPRCPGPTNQKSVPGLSQIAVGSPPAPVCSTASARAIDPVARMITPPRDGSASTLPPAADWLPADGAPAGAAAVRTVVRVSTPGRERVISEWPALALPGADRLLTTAVPPLAGPAWPVPVAAPMIATPPAAWLPGDGQARIAVVTGARLGGTAGRPAASATGWLNPASA